ncbi:hypothetical protein CYY_005377 [Polysphondylium violaceum]|uniref:Uncharacterized protein n=1 Tax=Polysphondylium violaceum TaxID=133409 RepID=A0A8J4PV65_9MYCE|nr:hypothetical protein CYY_005377 [Polysphondylium violaceum]
MIRKNLSHVLPEKSILCGSDSILKEDEEFFRNLFKLWFPQDYYLHFAHQCVFSSLPLLMGRCKDDNEKAFYGAKYIHYHHDFYDPCYFDSDGCDDTFFDSDQESEFVNNGKSEETQDNNYRQEKEEEIKNSIALRFKLMNYCLRTSLGLLFLSNGEYLKVVSQLRSLQYISRSFIYKPTIDEDTKVIEIVRDGLNLRHGVYRKDPENVILDWERKETICLIPDESNNYTKSVWANCSRYDFYKPNLGMYEENEGGVEVKSKVKLSNFSQEKDIQKIKLVEYIKYSYNNDKEEEEDVNEDDYEYYPFNRYERGNGNPDIDIECYDKFDFYVSKAKLEQIQSFCGGNGVLSETIDDLCFNLTYTDYKKDKEDFDYNVLQDPELIYKLRDINKFIEHSKENINDIEFIGFNMKVKLNILREMSRLSFFCPDMVHFIGYSECKYGSEKSCYQSTCNMGRLELYEAILQIYFYNYKSYYFKDDEYPGYQNYIFSTEFSIPYKSDLSLYFEHDKMVYFEISFQGEDPFPLQAPYGFYSEFCFKFKIQFLILDINDIKSKNTCNYQTLYIRNEDENKPKTDESFIDGVRKSFKHQFPNFKFDIILLLKSFKLDLFFFFDFKTNKKVCRYSPYLELRPLIESGNVGFYNFCERSNIKSTLQKEENSCDMKRPFYGI